MGTEDSTGELGSGYVHTFIDPSESKGIASMAALIYSYFVCFLLSLWICAGLADWLCHRKERIEMTTGVKESLLHLLMLLEIGLPVLYCLFFEVNATTILVSIIALLLHEITSWWDVRFAYQYRRIGPVEQHIHGFLERLPLFAFFCMAVIYHEQFLGLVGVGDTSPVFFIRLKPAWPFDYVAGTLSVIFFLLVVPYLEELWRCSRYKGSPLSQQPSDNVLPV